MHLRVRFLKERHSMKALPFETYTCILIVVEEWLQQLEMISI